MLDDIIIRLIRFWDSMRFGVKDKIFIYRELAYLIKGGVSILESFKMIRSHSENVITKQICDSIHTSLRKGETLSRSFAKQRKYFNEGDINIIRSGENSGELVKVLNYLSNEYSFLHETKNKYISAMVYPVIIFLVSIAAIYILVKFILPGMIAILGDFQGVEIPWATQFLIWLSDFVNNQSHNILIILILFIFGIGIIASIEEGRNFLEQRIINMPIIGKISKYYLLVKFLRYMRLLIYAGLSYLEVFELMKSVMGSEIYKTMMDDILLSLRKGENFVEVIHNYRIIIPADVEVLLRVGQETATISGAIDNAIWMYEGEFNHMMDNLSKVIEPIFIIVAGVLVAIIAFSVFGVIGTIMDSMQY